MTYDEIFAEYYPMYRGQATVPASTDREYLLGIPLANNAIRRWDRADGVLWNELYTTARSESSSVAGTLIFDAATSSFSAASNIRKIGSELRLTDPTNVNNFKKIPIVPVDSVYAKSPNGTYAYFVGSANTETWTCHLVGNYTSYDNWLIDYMYYKKPTMIEDGDSITEMSDPNFIIQSMLQSRFVNSRNGFAYNDAKAEASVALANMVIENNSGSPGSSWNLLDTDQTPGFGSNQNSSFFGSN